MTTFDDTVNGFFPDTDQGHPQTAHTQRVADIMAWVSTLLADEGHTWEAYNFRDDTRRHEVTFNTRQPNADGGCDIGASLVTYKTLATNTDAAIIERCSKFTLALIRGEVTELKLAVK